MNAVDRFVEAARRAGLEPDVHTFPQGTRTAADAAAAVGCDVAQIVKSLVFEADGQVVLVLTSGANRVDEAAVAAQLEVAALGKADADQVRKATGFAIGGTPPCGHPESLPTLMDEDLLVHDQVWAAAGTPDTCWPVAPADLARITEARVVRVAP